VKSGLEGEIIRNGGFRAHERMGDNASAGGKDSVGSSSKLLDSVWKGGMRSSFGAALKPTPQRPGAPKHGRNSSLRTLLGGPASPPSRAENAARIVDDGDEFHDFDVPSPADSSSAVQAWLPSSGSHARLPMLSPKHTEPIPTNPRARISPKHISFERKMSADGVKSPPVRSPKDEAETKVTKAFQRFNTGGSASGGKKTMMSTDDHDKKGSGNAFSKSRSFKKFASLKSDVSLSSLSSRNMLRNLTSLFRTWRDR